MVYTGDGSHVGYGYAILYEGQMLEPILFDTEGNDLPRKQWYNLVFTSEESLVVVNKTVQ